MDEQLKIEEEIVQLCRLALRGRRHDVELYIRRLYRRWKATRPQLAETIIELLNQTPLRHSVLKNEPIAALPVDIESRLKLARYEEVTELETDPIWSKAIKVALEQIISERERERELYDANLSPTRSILFTGPPGVGKSLAARWIAIKLKRPLLILDLSAVMSSFLGRTGNNLRNVLDYARTSHCVLLLDEFDAIAKRRDDAVEVGELKRLVTVLLQEIDDWPSTGILVAATNHPQLLDPAVWRRFDLVLNFTMPTYEQTQQAIIQFLGPLDRKAEPWHKTAALALHGLSFNDIEHEMFKVRREAVVSGEPIESRFESVIRDRLGEMPRGKRLEIGLWLQKAGYSQRKIQELTGVSRDTIRKASLHLKKDTGEGERWQ